MDRDILNDPRYDATPRPTEIVISRAPTVIEFSRRKMLKLIGLPMSATWEQAAPILKGRLVSARDARDDEAAIKWSVIRDQLQKKLARVCASCGCILRPKICRDTCPQCSDRKDIPESFYHQLGKWSDTRLAKIYGLRRRWVTRERRRRGIRPYDAFSNDSFLRPKRDWPKEITDRLGTVSDHQLARIFRLNRNSVTCERRRRCIPVFRCQVPRRILPIEIINRIGTDSDRNIARACGVEHTAVSRERRRRGIPVFRSCR